MAPVPKRATTTILLKEKYPERFEVFLLRRHEKNSFMGGNYVYPGGRIDLSDHNLEICRHTRGGSPEEAQEALGEPFSPEESLACWIAGIGKSFEEAGILLAYDQHGAPFTLKNPEERERFSGYRDLLQEGSTTLCQVAQKEHLSIALDQLHYYARWITPEARPQRFDTHFFIARHPEGQEANHDQKETTAGIWITPGEALKENLTGGVVLSPPTLITLEDLSRYETVDEVIGSLKDKDIRPILPVFARVSGEPVITFPWDPEYERFQRGEISDSIDHGTQSCSADNTTRVIQRDGRWHPYHKSKTA